MTVYDAVLMWIIGALFGSMVFFAIAVTPKAFQTLQQNEARSFLRAIFPAYYRWGLALSAAAAVMAIWSSIYIAIACLMIFALFAVAHYILTPRINKARDAQMSGESGAGEIFKLLHLTGVIINAVQLLVLLASAVALPVMS